MNRFINNTLSKEISLAIKIAEELLMPGSKMIEEISKKNDFAFNSGNGLSVAMKLMTKREPLPVFTYKSVNPWSKAIGGYDGKVINLNSRMLPKLNIKELAGCLCHEWSHYAGFGHGNNFPGQDKNLYSVPYFLSEWVSRQTSEK